MEEDQQVMKSAARYRYGNHETLVVVERPIPQFGEDELLVKVDHSAITAADTFLRSGTPLLGRFMLGLLKPKNPYIGTGYSGVVVGAGEKIEGFKVGDSVFGESGLGFAANSEYVIVKDEVIAKRPSFLKSDAAACICDGALTSFNFLWAIGKLKSGQKVLINGGAGSLGSSAIQIAKSLGAHVTATSSEKNFDYLKSLGADSVIDYKSDDYQTIQNRYDLIFDTVGKLEIASAKKMLKKDGHYMSPVLSFGVLFHMIVSNLLKSRKKISFSATGLLDHILLKKFIAQILNLIKSGKLNIHIDRYYSIYDLPQAHKLVDSGHKKGNLVLDLAK